MTMQSPRITVIGAGAIGGVTAGFLARKGRRVEIVCKHREALDRIRSQGLHVKGPDGAFQARMNAVLNIADLRGQTDVVLIATKTNDAVDAARRIEPFIGEQTLVLSLQNGIVEDDIAQIVGKARVVGCVVGWSATLLGPADVAFTRAAEFIVGDLYAIGEEKVQRAAAILQDAMPTRISVNIRGELFSKLILNCCINALAAVSGLALGPLLSRKRARDLFIAVMREAVAVADAAGVRVEPALGGLLDYHAFLAGDDDAARQKRDDTLVFMGQMSQDVKPSSVQSLERGKPTETAWLNGYIIELAEKTGLSVPMNHALVNIIDQIENGSIGMSPRILDLPALQPD